MEHDRYQKNHALYIIGMISLVISLSLLALTLFIVPHMLLGLTYDVPDFVSTWKEWLRVNADMNASQSSLIITLVLFILTFLFALITYSTSNRLENQIFSDELKNKIQTKRMNQGHREAAGLIFKLLIIMLFIFMAAELLLWLIK